ncbi:unnamed protein product, partial [Didymodactylos carnosus]
IKTSAVVLERREKLFQVYNDNSISSIDSSPAIPINSSLPDSPLKSMNNLSTNDCMIDQMLGKATITQETNLIFPDEYKIPVLPKSFSPRYRNISIGTAIVRKLQFPLTKDNIASSALYPTMVVSDDVIYIYVDYLPIVSTTSLDDVLALLLGMYAELNFSKSSRVIRLLYTVVFCDK